MALRELSQFDIKHPRNNAVKLAFVDNNNESKEADNKNERRTPKILLRNFVDSTTAHGLPRIFAGRGVILSLFWAAIFFTALGVSIWQISELILQFQKRDVNIRIEVVTSQGLNFPSVSICNTNKLRKSAIAESKYQDLVSIDTEVVRPYYAESCLEGDFRCGNNGCIKSYLRCDGNDNCRDRSDEVGCVYGSCGTNQFKCVNGSDMGVCIDVKYRCDRHLDCYDGEDENDCDCKDKREFSCTENGRCIPINKLCDGVNDCVDVSDEANCTKSGMLCASDYFQCDGDRQCIPPHWECDGYSDCDDGTDEVDCDGVDTGGVVVCSGTEFQCDPYNCIPLNWQCDEYPDCANGVDEWDCGEDDVCEPPQFSCDTMLCIVPQWVCDGYPDCVDGSDEEEEACQESYSEDSSDSFSDSDYGDCGNGFVFCDNRTNCIPDEWMCDLVDDCDDGSDEDDCDYQLFTCDNGTETFPIQYQCDVFRDCEDGYDESIELCKGNDTFLCTDGGDDLISLDLVCDGSFDCVDGSDERDCNGNGTTFLCYPSGDVIDKKYVCNNVVDCDDASDEISCVQNMTATHQPDARELQEQFRDISNDVSVYQDFVDNYYNDHMLGRVVSEHPSADWRAFAAYSSAPDYSDLEDVLKLRKDEIRQYGHQIEDFILDCSFDKQACDLERDFKLYQDDKYGNCFMFNHLDDDGNQESLYTTKTGAKYGLKMTLFLEQHEYISVYGRDSGARIVLSPPGVPALPSSEGFTIQPGMVTSLGIKKKTINRKPHPYGPCLDNLEYNSTYGTYYSQKECEESCIQQTMLEYCGCVDTVHVDGERCMLLNRTQDVCKQLVNYLAQQQLLGCECRQACEESWYDATLSQSLWPSNIYLKHLLKQIHHQNSKTNDINDVSTASQNLIRVEVYFEELNYESITETPAISAENLLSDIGGTLGLYCGFSFITIVEFLHFCLDVLYVSYMNAVHGRINQS